MHLITEVTHWINISVDLEVQFFPKILTTATSVIVLRNSKQFILDIKEKCQNFQFYIDDEADSEKKTLLMNYDKQHTAKFLCVLHELSGSHFSYIMTLQWLRIGYFPKYSIS